jgi:uncharacterized protein
MKIPFLHLFMTSPFSSLIEHAEKVKECTWAFQQAVECHVSKRCETFEEHRQEVAKLKSEADIIKEQIRTKYYKRSMSQFTKLYLMIYIKEQDNIVRAVVESLDWLSHRNDEGIPEELKKEVFLLVDAVIEPIEELNNMLAQAKIYSRRIFRKKKAYLKNGIASISQKHNEADKAEYILKHRIFSLPLDPNSIYHMVRFAEIVGTTADHAENAGEIMGVMAAR